MRRRFGYEELGFGILIGLTVGSLIGILYAPQEGSKSRNQLNKYLKDVQSSVAETWPDFQYKVDQVLLKAQAILGLQKKIIRRRLDELKNELKNIELNQVS